MKKITLITLILCFLVSTTGATVPTAKKMEKKEFTGSKFTKQTAEKKRSSESDNQTPKKKTQAPSSKIKRSVPVKSIQADPLILVEEDFRNFTLGTEATPDATDITDPDTGEIPDSYTQAEGWGGFGVYQAGGMAFIGIVDWGGEYGEGPGSIETPYYDASASSGNYTIKFKARSVNASGDYLEVYWNNSEDYAGEYVEITNTWEEYTVEASEGDELSFVDIYGYGYEFYIDDIQIIQEPESGVSAPVATAASNITETGFTANWQAVSNATAYLLSVYSYEEGTSGTQEITVTEGFDQINAKTDKTIDIANPNYPAGWTIDVVQGSNARHIYTTEGNYSSAPLSLSFADTGDNIVTPLLTAPMTKLSVWLKMQTGSGSTINVEVYDGTSWQSIATLNVPDYEGEVVNLTSYLPANALQARFTYTKVTGNCSVDDVSYTYGGSTSTINYLFEEREVTGTSYDVTGITDGTQYYYRVKATDGTEKSTYSNEIKVEEEEPVELEAPVMLRATNVTDTGFTANWQASTGAEGYVFYTYLTHKVSENKIYTLADEDFNTVTAEDSPGGFIDYPDAFTKRPDWAVYIPEYNDGMLGFSNDLASLGVPGMLVSPAYELPENAKITIEISAVSAIGDELYVSNIYGDGDDDYEVDNKAFTAENQTFTFEFNSQAALDYSGNLFVIESTTEGITYIDDVKITIEMKAGEMVIMPYYYEETTSTSTSVSTADKVAGDSYSYSAYAYAESADGYVYSEFAEHMSVSNETGLDINQNNIQVYIRDNNLHVVLEKDSIIEVYNISGQMLSHTYGNVGENIITLSENGVYIVKAGKQNIKIVR